MMLKKNSEKSIFNLSEVSAYIVTFFNIGTLGNACFFRTEVNS